MWKDDRFGKSEKGNDRNSKNMDMKESVNKIFQVPGSTSELLSETGGWKDPTSGTDRENHCISNGSMCSDDRFYIWKLMYCNTFKMSH